MTSTRTKAEVEKELAETVRALQTLREDVREMLDDAVGCGTLDFNVAGEILENAGLELLTRRYSGEVCIMFRVSGFEASTVDCETALDDLVGYLTPYLDGLVDFGISEWDVADGKLSVDSK